ncbi:MAG: hypothetical protein A2V70_07155 [Planctomycetes bacterium RBG_13_63_9]|nr:MAG: hypothetical protein A2V70_07155 [Planctomycetes bacterium RBG_13_63_9]
MGRSRRTRSARKQDDTRRELAAEKVQGASEERFREMFDDAVVGFYRTTPDGRILMANPALVQMLGYSSFEELAQRNLEREGFGPHYSRSEFKQRIHRHGKILGMEATWIKRDGTMLFVRETAKLVCDGEGNPLYYEGMVEDNTDRRRAEERAQRHLEQLAHLERRYSMGEMVSVLAHELNQPLGTVGNYAQVCRRRIRDLNEQNHNELVEAVDQIIVQTERAAEIIRRLRSFVRRVDASRSTTDVNELVRGMTVLLEIEARLYDVHLELALDRSLPKALVDRIQIEQVVSNLVRNAMEATQGGPGGCGLVTIRTSMSGPGTIEVAVVDTGKGLEGEGAERVFEPFYTTKSDGMGLGLSISRSIIEAHGGRLEAEPNADRGATFRFTLPVGDAGDQP